MTEKRFRITTNPKSQSVVFDERQKKHYIGSELEDLLNKQQAAIDDLEKERDSWKNKNDCEFILCQDDLGNYEIRYDDDKVFHFLWEVAPVLNEQQSTIIKQAEEIKKLKRTERSWRKIHCCNKESDNCGIVIEQQATLSDLKEENEQLKKRLEHYAKVEALNGDGTNERL